MKYFYTVFTILIIHSSWHFTASAQNVEFPDPNLAAAVRGALGLGATDPIPQTNLNTLTYLFASNAGITDLTGLEYATGLWDLYLPRNQVSDISRLASLTRLVNLDLDGNQVSDISPLASLTRLETLDLSKNPISNFAPLAGLTALTSLNLLGTGFSNSDFAHISLLVNLMRLELSDNEISALEGLGAFPNLIYLHLNGNQIRDITPLAGFTSLTQLYLSKNQITDLSPLAGLTGLTWLYINSNQVSDLTPLTGLTGLRRLIICYNPFTDISPIASLTGLTILSIDEAFVESVGVIPGRVVYPCAPLPDPPPEPETSSPEPEPEPEPAVKQRSSIARCGLGWAPHSQYQHHGELPKVMIYALEFEYDPEGHGRYICNTIEIRTGDDSIENLAGWNLYLGTLYNPSSIPLKIPEEHSQITDRILRITPEMLGLETFPCTTVNGISHPLPGVQYVLKTDENVLIDTAYSCFIWGQNAYTTVNGVNVKSQRRISSQALRAMETPRIERYIMKPTSIFLTYIPFEDFAWDRAVLSDWLLGSSEEMEITGGNAPSYPYKKLTTSWAALKKPEISLRNEKRR